MRSRLHSDIGRFTGLGTQSVVRERERETEVARVVVRKEEEEREREQEGNPWRKDRVGICEGVPITFRIGDSPYILRIERPRSSPVSTTYFPCKCMYLRNLILIPAGIED